MLDPEQSGYVTFHLDVVACPYCRANLDDLQKKADVAGAPPQDRRKRIFHSSRHLLSGDDALRKGLRAT